MKDATQSASPVGAKHASPRREPWECGRWTLQEPRRGGTCRARLSGVDNCLRNDGLRDFLSPRRGFQLNIRPVNPRLAPWASMLRPYRGCRSASPRPCLRGFSLLEVILALAILTGAIAVIGELVRIGTRNAEAARDLTQAQLLCESKLAEIASGLATAESVSMSLCPDDQDWLYSVAVESTAETGIVAVRVTFTRNLPNQQQPLEFSMVQWMPDPATATSTDASSEGPSSTTGTTGAGNG